LSLFTEWGPPRRVLLVIDSLDGGGAERYVVDLAIALRSRGWDVEVACSAAGVRAARLRAANVPVNVLAGSLVKRRLSVRYVRALRRLQGEANERRLRDAGMQRTRVLLIGAGQAGVMVAREIQNRPDLGLHAVGFLDDDPTKVGTSIGGVPVLGTTAQVGVIAERKRVDRSRDSPFIVGVFAGLESDGEISVYSVNVDYVKPREGLASAEPFFLTSMPFSDDYPDDFPLLTPFGMPEIVHEISEGKSARAQQEINTRHILQKTLSAEAYARSQVIRMVDLTIAYHPKQEFVGGRIDAIELPRDGKVHWVQRKQNCPEN